MARLPRPAEFDIIRRYFAPLAAGADAALGLVDDAAVVALPDGHRQVITTDTLIEGVHFFAADPPDQIARKMLRVNLSDVAAMGATPTACLLAISLADHCDEAWIAAFAGGLGDDLRRFGVSLVGGDTTATPGPVTLTLTALGVVPAGAEIRRSTAGAGDDVYVSGTIGDAALGLRLLDGRLALADPAARALLIGRYRLPEPRTVLGPALRGVATAMADISDGLVADLGHITETSGVGAVIEADRVPRSPAARGAEASDPALLAAMLTGGDDYELVFTAPPGRTAAVAAAAAAAAVPVTAIGRIVADGGVTVLDAAGRPLALVAGGYQHR